MTTYGEIPRSRRRARLRCTARSRRRRRLGRAGARPRAQPRASSPPTLSKYRSMPSRKRLARVGLAVVERLVEPELPEPRDLLGRSGAADHTAALQLRDLPHEPSRRRLRRPETKMVSPASGRPMSSSPTYAVSPGMPRTPSAVETGASAGIDTARGRCRRTSASSRQPSAARDPRCPRRTRSFRDATTCAYRTAAHDLAEQERRHVRLDVVHPRRASTGRSTRTRSGSAPRRRPAPARRPRRGRNRPGCGTP